MTLPVLSELMHALNVSWGFNTAPINKILYLQYIGSNSESVESQHNK